MTNKVPQVFVPDVSREVGPQTQTAVRQLFMALHEHETAFASLKSQVDAKVDASSMAAKSSSTPVPTAATVALAVMSQLGRTNTQSGASYTLQDSDYGGVVVLVDNGPVAVTLNSACRQFWFGCIENLTPNDATLTPDVRSVNSKSSITLQANAGCWLFYDGMNWWALTTPLQPMSVVATPGEYLTGYDPATGTFTVSPLPSDLAYRFDYTQNSPSATWVIVHNLNTYPAVAVQDSTGAQVYGAVHYDSPNQLTVTFSAAFAGKAHLT